MKPEIIKNEGKNKITLNLTDDELLSINDTFAVIKKGGSRLDCKEAMVKLLVLKETRMYDFLNVLKTPKNRE